jgi:hypothetical protein
MPEHLIAEHMAERVIDGLEIVHINEQERRPVLLVILKRLGNLLLYALAVGQPGQRIGIRLFPPTVYFALPFVDVGQLAEIA